MKTATLTEKWTAKLRRRLAGRGSKAELARFLQERYGRTERSWQTHLQHILAGRQVPSAEIYLAIELWTANESARGRSAAPADA